MFFYVRLTVRFNLIIFCLFLSRCLFMKTAFLMRCMGYLCQFWNEIYYYFLLNDQGITKLTFINICVHRHMTNKRLLNFIYCFERILSPQKHCFNINQYSIQLSQTSPLTKHFVTMSLCLRFKYGHILTLYIFHVAPILYRFIIYIFILL